MPTFSSKLYEIRTRQTLFNQECINLYFYRDDETGPAIGLSAIAAQFNTDVLRVIEGIQNENVEGFDLRVRLLGGGVEHVDNITTQFGERMGAATTSFSAWGFILNRTNIDIRNGSKRFAGVSDDDASSNVPVVGMTDLLNDVADALKATLILTNTAELTPVIYRRESFIDGDWFGSVVADAAFRKVTSQVSRKFELE